MSADCIVTNGRLVIPQHGILDADIAIKNGKITAIGRDVGEARETLDAGGQLVFPGCVDVHMHYGHFNEFYDEMATESKCMAALGDHLGGAPRPLRQEHGRLEGAAR
jgi:dihydroorotase-like cyclic amidohydrolase